MRRLVFCNPKGDIHLVKCKVGIVPHIAAVLKTLGNVSASS